MQSITADGGLTWEGQRLIAQHEDALPDEPGVIRSPDGKQIAAVMREQSRAYKRNGHHQRRRRSDVVGMP